MVFAAMRGAKVRFPDQVAVEFPLADDDLHLALYCCYELHYRGFEGVDPDLEWDPTLLAFRARLEQCFVAGLARRLGSVAGPVGPVGPTEPVDRVDPVRELTALATGAGGRSLSRHLLRWGTVDQFREFCIHRSAYQLKEADPHTWAIPRLAGSAKAALVHLQFDEYGGGRLDDMHSTLFARTMAALGLDTTYGAYLDLLPGLTLATTNLVTMFGLHRRWRGALVGHLALFEMTSVGPMGRYRDTLHRLGFGSDATEFYEVHVEADVEHEVIALRDLVAGLVASEPRLARDIVFGARALTLLEANLTDHLLDSWRWGESSLLAPPTVAIEPEEAACR